MKKLHNILTILGVCGAMISLSSCEDVFDTKDPGQNPDEPAKKYFMAVRLYDNNNTGTRGIFDSPKDNVGQEPDLFNKGLDEERALFDDFGMYERTPHFILFFDTNGVKQGNILYLSRWSATSSDVDESNDYYSSYKTLYASIDENDPLLKFGASGEGTALVVLNANDRIKRALWADNLTLSSAKNLIVNETDDGEDYLYFKYTKDDGSTTKYFTMSSSIIVNGTSVEPANKSTATDGTIKWYSSEVEASRNPSFEMFVERLQTKYTMVFKKGTSNSSPYYYFNPTAIANSNNYTNATELILTQGEDFIAGYDQTTMEDYRTLKYVTSYTRGGTPEIEEKNWKVNIIGWAPNALETEEYLFKQISLQKAPFNNSSLNWWMPDNPADFWYRNYWGIDTHYDTGTYPQQKRSVRENANIKVLDNITSPSLKYLSFDELKIKQFHNYSSENTFTTDVFTNLTENPTEEKAYFWTGTHIIVPSQLLIDGMDGNAYSNPTVNSTSGLVENVKSKYFMFDAYWNETDYLNYVIEHLGYCLLSASNQIVKEDERNDGRKIIEKFGPNDGMFYLPNGANDYRIADYRDFTTDVANIKGGDGWVRIKPKDGTILFIKNDSGEFISLATLESTYHEGEEIDLFENLVYEHPEYMAGHFNEGRMYYAVPVKHNTYSGKFNPVTLGDYGAVRNHWYFFTVDGIYAPGTPVSVTTDKIVPNNQPKYSAIDVNISILEWHKVTTEVDLDGQIKP